MKYFVISDIHGHASEMKRALKEKGFRISNSEHVLVVLGDIFDRFDEALEVYQFLKKIPQNRRILIKGNHEELYFSLLKKNYPQGHDFSNGTVDTFCQIAGEDNKKVNELRIISYFGDEEELITVWKDIRTKVAISPVTKFLKSKEWKNYFELDEYIFVHSFIPHIPDWRNAPEESWEEALWGCPWQQYQLGYFNQEIKNNKILVCGHWHTSDFYQYLDHDMKQNRGIYKSPNLIAIDGGCWFDEKHNLVHTQNVLVIEK